MSPMVTVMAVSYTHLLQYALEHGYIASGKTHDFEDLVQQADHIIFGLYPTALLELSLIHICPLYLAAADAVIPNNGTLDEALRAAMEALDEIFDS